jgi:hypothetical protein
VRECAGFSRWSEVRSASDGLGEAYRRVVDSLNGLAAVRRPFDHTSVASFARFDYRTHDHAMSRSVEVSVMEFNGDGEMPS